MRTTTYMVDDIHCGGCEGMIRTLLSEVVWVRQVDPDRRTNQVIVTFNETEVDDTVIRQALANTGFPSR